MMSKLTDKQERFCQEYIKDLNATQAAIRAGYSEKTARQIGTENLAKPATAHRITELKVARIDEIKIDSKWVLQQMKDIHELDVLDILDNTGNFKSIKKWPKLWRQYISGLDIQEMMSGDTESVVRKIKWPDKVKNLEMIGRHVDVSAWDKDKETSTIVNNIMPVPVADSVEDWEAAAKKNQEALLGNG